MPKKLYKVANFHGGLDETSSPVDMRNGFFTNLTDVMVDFLGKIVPMGDFDTTPTNSPTSTGFLVDADPGYGLFAYTSNRKLSGALTNCVIYVAQQQVASDMGENFIFWGSEDTDNWSTLGPLNLEQGTTASQFLPDYLAYDGTLRICDGNFANITAGRAFATTTNRGWVGYIDNYQFANISGTGHPLGSEQKTQAWKTLTNATPAAPTRGAVSSLLSAVSSSSDATSLTLTEVGTGTALDTELTNLHYIIHDHDSTGTTAPQITGVTADGLAWGTRTWLGLNEGYRIYPPAGTGVNIDIAVSTTGGYLPDVGDDAISVDLATYTGYTMGSTFVYDGYQESPIFEMAVGWTTLMDPDIPGIVIEGAETSTGSISGTAMFAASYDERITGSRIYCRHTDDQNANWFLMWDIDFAQGVRTNMTTSTYSGQFTLDELHGDNNDRYVYIELPTFTGPLGETYFSINGYQANENIEIRYKTSAIVAGRIFVGNVYREVDGKAQILPDHVYYTPVTTYSGRAAPDVFPESLFLENASLSDPIVKLIGLGNQLLIFGMGYLTIWTLGASDAITGTFAGYGVAHPSHVVKTPTGIVFANNSGLFLYNGQGVTNLLQKSGEA